MRAAFGFVLALTAATLCASVVQTQINLASLSALGIALPAVTRLSATAHDLVFFAPMFALLVAPLLAAGFALAHLLARFRPELRTGLVVVTPAMLMFALLAVIHAVPAVPAVISGGRGIAGMLLISLTMAAGGGVMAAVTGSRRTR